MGCIKKEMEMKIKIDINPETLGDNSDDENARYAAAVRKAVSDEYPDAVVEVNLGADASDVVVTENHDWYINDDWYVEKVLENIDFIMRLILDRQKY